MEKVILRFDVTKQAVYTLKKALLLWRIGNFQYRFFSK